MVDPVSIFAPSQQSLGPLGKMRAQAEELEGVFLNTLMSQLFSSIETEGDFGGGFAEETWRSMQSEQYAAAMAETGGIGLADQLVSELMKLQEVKGAS
jgi:flagellar protein FlgJ